MRSACRNDCGLLLATAQVYELFEEMFTQYVSFTFVFVAEQAYYFCFLLMLTSCGLFVLYMSLAVDLSAEDFSFIAKTNCPMVEGFNSDAQVAALNDTLTSGCVYQVAWHHEYGKLSNFFVVYVTTLVFYALTLVEGLDFINVIDPQTGDEAPNLRRWIDYGRLLLVIIILIDVITFLVSCVRLWAERETTTWSLEHNNPSNRRCKELVYSILLGRGVSMSLMWMLVVASHLSLKNDEKMVFEKQKSCRLTKQKSERVSVQLSSSRTRSTTGEQ